MRELQVVNAAELAAAFAAADYSVLLDGETLPLRVGDPAADLEAYWPARRYVFITAWNPASEPRSDTANETADALLVGRLDDAGAVGLAIDRLGKLPLGTTAIGSRTRGWYGEVAWNLLSFLGKGDRELSPFVRYEALDTQASVAPGFARDPENDRTVRTYGVTWRPIANIAIKADFQDAGNRAGTAVDQFNVALGYLF